MSFPIKSFCIGILVMAFNTPALANDKSDGCGLGWYVTKRTSLSATSTRGTTNAYFPPTFSMTSGTSNCAQHDIVKAEKETQHFVEANFDELQFDIAKGKGEYVNALSTTLGCDDSIKVELFSSLQVGYKRIYPGLETTPTNAVQNIRTIIREQPAFDGKCSRVS